MPGKKEDFDGCESVDCFEFDFSIGSHERLQLVNSMEDEICSTDDECRTVSEVLRSRSGSNSTSRRIRNVSLNMTQNSDDEGEDSSMLSSSDIDLEESSSEESDEGKECMDALVLNIKEKLCMEHTHRRRPYVNPPPSRKNGYDPLRSIQKKSTKSSGVKSYWAAAAAANSTKSRENPYQLLQQLLDSGSLIKEAVRRLSTTKPSLPISSSPSSSNYLQSLG